MKKIGYTNGAMLFKTASDNLSDAERNAIIAAVAKYKRSSDLGARLRAIQKRAYKVK